MNGYKQNTLEEGNGSQLLSGYERSIFISMSIPGVVHLHLLRDCSSEKSFAPGKCCYTFF